MEVKDRVERLNERVARYLPPRESWNPAEEAVYKPTDLYCVPLNEAQEMQLKSIKYAFSRHYTHNRFYHNYCEEENVRPEDIKTYDDLEKIPLIPDSTFKQHPSGKEVAYWLKVIFTGDLPKVVINGANPTLDDVINAFNAAGLVVGYTSGTSGRPSVIPRDMRQCLTAAYLFQKLMAAMWDDDPDHALSLFPSAKNTNLAVGQGFSLQPRVYRDHRYALDFEIPADTVQKAMQGKDQHATAQRSAYDMRRKILESSINWLERYEKTTDTIHLFGLPFIFLGIMSILEREGRRFEFGERGTVLTAGGWKTNEDKRVSAADFRKQVEQVLGIPETRSFDFYGMVEVNGASTSCPEGHYLHLPYTWLKPLALDKHLTPAGYGEWGRLAFLDGLANSYPGFIITGDEVCMYEHCPVCDRPGPVLDPEIKRAEGEEVRGCAEVISRVFAETLQGDNS
jgi:hypothetical protein